MAIPATDKTAGCFFISTPPYGRVALARQITVAPHLETQVVWDGDYIQWLIGNPTPALRRISGNETELVSSRLRTERLSQLAHQELRP